MSSTKIAESNRTLILSKEMVAQKIQRIAWELYEKHATEDSLYVVGISKSGYWLAQQIFEALQKISGLQLSLIEMEINKKNPLSKDVNLSVSGATLTNQNVVLVDDVLKSGNVLIYGVRHLLEQPLKKLTTAVLVDRSHKRFPVTADVKGLSLSTSLQEHVEVVILADGAEVYLR